METQTTKLEPPCTRTKEELEQAAREAYDKLTGNDPIPDGYYTATQLGKLLGKSRTGVRERLLRNKVAHIMVKQGGHVVPAWKILELGT